MDDVRLKILINTDTSGFNVLLKALEYYSNASALFEYGEHIEECQELRCQIFKYLQVCN